MPDEPKKTRLTPPGAKRKWGELLAPTRTYAHFEEAGGEWRPELQGGELAGYRWSKLQKAGGANRWRRR